MRGLMEIDPFLGECEGFVSGEAGNGLHEA